MTLKDSRAAYKGHHTKKRNRLELMKRRRFPRLAAAEIARQLRHCIETNQMIWDSDLIKLVADDAKKQGLHLM